MIAIVLIISSPYVICDLCYMYIKYLSKIHVKFFLFGPTQYERNVETGISIASTKHSNIVQVIKKTQNTKIFSFFTSTMYTPKFTSFNIALINTEFYLKIRLVQIVTKVSTSTIIYRYQARILLFYDY